MFRYDTGVDGTTFWVATSRLTSTTTTTTSAAIAANTAYTLKIVVNSTSSVDFYVDGTNVATHTTNLPGSTTDPYLHPMVRNLAASARTIRFGKVYMESL